MTKLYGVTHGGSLNDMFRQESVDVTISPSREFYDELLKLPKGAKVGIEWLPTRDWRFIEEHANRLLRNQKPPVQGKITYKDSAYWDSIINYCERAGFNIIFLESKSIFQDYNSASVALVRERQALEEVLKSDIDDLIVLCNAREKVHNAEVMQRKIHELDRDKAILDTIKNNSLDAAIVGLGHSDPWIMNPSIKCLFTSYATDTVEVISYNSKAHFNPNPSPNPVFLYDNMNLIKAVNLIKTGRLTDKVPDYVGTWSPYCPSEGYFELFVKDYNPLAGLIEGIIEDLLGTSSFIGQVNSKKISFVKEYTLAGSNASNELLKYEGERKGIGYFGHYTFKSGGSGPFFLVNVPWQSPIDLVEGMHRAANGFSPDPEPIQALFNF